MINIEYKNIEDYGLIGNLDTCALVGNDGSIDWLPIPHLASPSIFGAILDHTKGGRFVIHPSEMYTSRQIYLENTNILETEFTTSGGRATVTDFMPVQHAEGQKTEMPRGVFRKIHCQEGNLEVDVQFQPRFDYGRVMPAFEKHVAGIKASGGGQVVFLQTSFPISVQNDAITAHLSLKRGDTRWCVLHLDETVPLTKSECDEWLQFTIRYWRTWAHSCNPDECVFAGPWHDLVVRSGLTLKLLTHPSTGAIAAAPTTSLPEEIGGVRNWDYRYAWIRDASFTAQALYDLGHKHEALEYFHWFQRICSRKRHPSQIQIMYTLHGGTDLEEIELGHLSGYKNSRPVRIGNKAAQQKQLDIYGELIDAFYETVRYERNLTEDDWKLICFITDYVCEVWNTPDFGIWEVRSEPKHFTYSKLMCWVALDRSIRMSEVTAFRCDIRRWKTTRDEIRETILRRAFNEKLYSFVQHFESEALDATGLLIPILGFLPYDDARVRGTIEATMRHLYENGFVYRYNGEDGLPGGEGAFILCTFWLVDVLALSGRIDEAEELYMNVLDHASPLGLFAEELDPQSGIHLGNYPQGFSHIGLINSALYIGKARGRTQIGPEPIG